VKRAKYHEESTKVSIVSVSRRAGPPQAGQVVVDQVGCQSSALPGRSKVAVVDGLAALANVATPGPLIWLHETVSVPPDGRPSSLTEPLSFAGAGRVISWSGPALTTGAELMGVDVSSGQLRASL
jgi:hypothetical protein